MFKHGKVRCISCVVAYKVFVEIHYLPLLYKKRTGPDYKPRIIGTKEEGNRAMNPVAAHQSAFNAPSVLYWIRYWVGYGTFLLTLTQWLMVALVNPNARAAALWLP